MTGITINVDLAGARAFLGALGTRTLPYVVKRALNDTAEDLLASEIALMHQVFDRPTPWVEKAFFFNRSTEATEENLVASIEPREFGGVPAYKVLKAEVFGGARAAKRHEVALRARGIMRGSEFAVPGQGVPLDGHGNMPGSLITRILSALGANPMGNETATSRKRQRRKGNQGFFVSRGSNRLRDGIYERKGGRVRPMIIFVHQPRYAVRYPFYDHARAFVPPRFRQRFAERFARYARGGG